MRGLQRPTGSAKPARILEPSTTTPSTWLIRLPDAFSDLQSEILGSLEAASIKKLGRDYLLIRTDKPTALHHSAAAKFLSWNLPVHHSWPCCPKETEGFIEKAAQALARKFTPSKPQTILIGALDPGSPNRYYRTLASNLRGRVLQLFPPACSMVRGADEQNPSSSSLYGLVGPEGLFCGLQSPLASSGFHPGGTRFIRQGAPGTISRAGAKVAEALHHLQLHRPLPEAGCHWLELGASPGGMTAELLERGYRVTAIDRAPLDPRLDRARPGLNAVVADVADFRPPPGTRYGGLLCDMNGSTRDAFRQVTRLSKFLQPGSPLVFTLKLPGVSSYAEINTLEASIIKSARAADMHVLDTVHLTYNRHEFTVLLQMEHVQK